MPATTVTSPRLRSRYDAIVVGGRAAGAATAMLLARRGLDVLVVERARRGSDTLSTHALMRAGVLQLQRWGLLGDILAAGTPAIRRTVFRYGDVRTVVDIPDRAGVDALYAPRRTLLDGVLADAAERAGADLHFSTRVTDLLTDPRGRVHGAVVRTVDGDHVAVRAPLTIGADGVRSIVARSVGAPVTRAGRGASFFIYGYWTDLPAQGYEWSYAPRASAGMIPTNGGTCVWVAGPAADFRLHRRDVAGALTRLLGAVSPSAAARVAAAKPSGEPVRGWAGHPGYLRRPWGPGWALVGDASHFKDPLSTHGLTDALRDAELLARAVDDGLQTNDANAGLAGYERLRDHLSLPLFEIVDELASYRWGLGALSRQHQALSRATNAEVAYLSTLDQHHAVAA